MAGEIHALRDELENLRAERAVISELVRRYKLVDESLRLRENETQARLDRLEAIAELTRPSPPNAA